MPFTWTELNVEMDDLLIACGLGNILHDEDPDYDVNIEDVGIMMNAAYGQNFKKSISYMVNNINMSEPIPSKVIEWVDFETYLMYEKAIFYFDPENFIKLKELLELALRDFSEELSLEPNDDNWCNDLMRSNPDPLTA